jgi:hypothetical protein
MVASDKYFSVMTTGAHLELLDAHWYTHGGNISTKISVECVEVDASAYFANLSAYFLRGVVGGRHGLREGIAWW